VVSSVWQFHDHLCLIFTLAGIVVE
jgi:hypothetical protein